MGWAWAEMGSHAASGRHMPAVAAEGRSVGSAHHRMRLAWVGQPYRHMARPLKALVHYAAHGVRRAYPDLLVAGLRVWVVHHWPVTRMDSPSAPHLLRAEIL